jgi:hypothetical protein
MFLPQTLSHARLDGHEHQADVLMSTLEAQVKSNKPLPLLASSLRVKKGVAKTPLAPLPPRYVGPGLLA